MNKSHWTYNDEIFDPTLKELEELNHYGFIYNITLKNGQMYIGRKYFWSKKTLPPLKGKKRKRHFKKESNWRVYKSSSNDVKELIQECNNIGVKYEILSFHPNKAETNFAELNTQIILNVLDKKDENNEYIYLNQNIALRYYRSYKFSDERIKLCENLKQRY